MGSATTMPVVWDGLIALFTAALADRPDVTVVNGPPVTVDPGADYVAVGFRGPYAGTGPTLPPPTVTSSATRSNIGNRLYDETFDLWCEASTSSGDTDVRAQLDATQAILDLLSDALRDDEHVGGTIAPPGFAAFGQIDWYPDQADTGCTVTAVFSIRVTVVAF